jgi:hypothetical protein
MSAAELNGLHSPGTPGSLRYLGKRWRPELLGHGST